jgi:hypothetical protein
MENYFLITIHGFYFSIYCCVSKCSCIMRNLFSNVHSIFSKFIFLAAHTYVMLSYGKLFFNSHFIFFKSPFSAAFINVKLLYAILLITIPYFLVATQNLFSKCFFIVLIPAAPIRSTKHYEVIVLLTQIDLRPYYIFINYIISMLTCRFAKQCFMKRTDVAEFHFIFCNLSYFAHFSNVLFFI